MELQQISQEKKSKPSFWNRFLRLPRKSSVKEKHDDSFKRQSMLYSSLNTTKKEKQGSSTSDDSENFLTLESSALEDVHRDAGILFLNKSSMENCFAPREENKHVQFAPTPMNKYYKVDMKSAPSKKLEEDKENVDQKKFKKPTRPILRFKKSGKTSSQSSSAEETESNPETKLVNVTCVDGPELKTPTIPRTSTKIALVDRKNGSMPQLNVSNIVKYNSLPRHPKIPEESPHFQDSGRFSMQSSDVKSTQSLSGFQNRNNSQKIGLEQMYRKSMRGLNTHRQSCYGVSDPSRIFEGKKILEAQNREAEHDMRRRLSLGPPVHFTQNVTSYCGNGTQKNYPVNEANKNVKIFFHAPAPPKKQGLNPLHHVERPRTSHACPLKSNENILNWQHHHASTGHIPNKAINQVGLPPVANKKGTSKIRSKSPQYIKLSQTTNKVNVKKSENNAPSNNYRSQHFNTGEFSGITSKAQGSSCLSVAAPQNRKQIIANPNLNNEQSVITEGRKQAILSSMYAQKRKIMNKLCKYNSKQSDEGFSSMADDECSFNCSCPTCVTKLSRSYKRVGLKQLFSSSKDKYFFTIEPEIKEGNELGRLPENQTFEGPMAVAQPHLSNKHENEQLQNKTWYDCNDTLCQTPGKNRVPVTIKEEEFLETPKNKMVENIYENITQIINSATKKNLTPQDVKKILSTPISALKSQKKSQRTLFPAGDGKEQLDQSLNWMLSPVKSSDCFNDSIMLLQEIFQKLSLECKELLQPNSTMNNSDPSNSTPMSKDSPGCKYVNDLIKNLKSSELNGSDFANIIGGIAQNIFSDTKAKKQKVRRLTHSSSMPDLQKKASLLHRAISFANSLKDLCDSHQRSELGIEFTTNISANTTVGDSALSGDCVSNSRQLPDGWRKTPTTESSDISPVRASSSGTDKNSSKCSEADSQILENAIRLGMGLAPVEKVKKAPTFALSPTKAAKYKSRDVLSGKGKYLIFIKHTFYIPTKSSVIYLKFFIFRKTETENI